MNVAKKPHVDGLCRESLGVSVPKPFWGGSMGLAYMDPAAAVYFWTLVSTCEKLME